MMRLCLNQGRQLATGGAAFTARLSTPFLDIALTEQNSQLPAFEALQAAPLSNLAYEVVKADSEKGEPLTALVIHGLFGSGRNWRTPARKLAEKAEALANKGAGKVVQG
jgi:hypothetical protein